MRSSGSLAFARACCAALGICVTFAASETATSPDSTRFDQLGNALVITEPAGQGAEIGLPRGRHVETSPVRAFEAWKAVARRKAGPLFRRISTAGGIGDTALHPDAVRRILAHRVDIAEVTVDGFERLSAHALRVGFITEAYDQGCAMKTSCATRHRDLRTMRRYIQRAGLVSESPTGKLDL